MLHTLLVGGALIGGVALLSPILELIPVAGPIFATIGTAAVTASEMVPVVIGPLVFGLGQVVFGVSKWGINKLGDVAKQVEQKTYKQQLINSINQQLNNLLNQIKSDMQTKIDINELTSQYIKIKFPQKQALEEKIAMLNTKKTSDYQDIVRTKEEILHLYKELEEYINGL